MERLEQALRKARSQRQGRGGLAADLLTRESAARPLVRSETPVVELDPRLLVKNHIIANQIDHDVTDVFRSLRAQVLRRLGKNGVSTLAITSLGRGEGKTTLAINLAIAISMDINQTVLLVDADLRTPSIARYLGVDVKVGLADVLAGRATIQECLINPGMPRLSILPACDSIDNSAELLSSPQMLHLVHEVKNPLSRQGHHIRSAAADDGCRHDRISADRGRDPSGRARRCGRGHRSEADGRPA